MITSSLLDKTPSDGQVIFGWVNGPVYSSSLKTCHISLVKPYFAQAEFVYELIFNVCYPESFYNTAKFKSASSKCTMLLNDKPTNISGHLSVSTGDQI
jgi:hypothetical protein